MSRSRVSVRTARTLCLLFVAAALLAGCRRPRHATGLRFDAAAYDALPRKARLVTRAYENLPSAVSLVDYAPYPGDQGDYGTCVAWASTYAGMTTADSVAQRRTDRRTTTERVFSPYYLYQMCNPGDLTGEGMYIETALWFLKNEGVPFRVEAERASVERFPLFDAPAVYEGSRKFTIGDYATLFSSDASAAQKISAVKKSLAERKPVLISFLPPRSFSYAREYWAPSVFDGTPDGGHAMLVVGYDNGRRGGSFCIQNSWGTDWGKDGYVWIAYDDFAQYTRGAFEMSTAIFAAEPEPAPEFIPPPLPHFAEPEPEPQALYAGAFTLRLRHPEGQEMRLALRDGVYAATTSYGAFTAFQLEMTNTLPCYVYAFASDEATGTANAIFPVGNTSALLDYAENTVVYPAEDKYIQLDGVAGTDYFVVLYSTAELDLAHIMERYGQAVRSGMTGVAAFPDRVRFAVGAERLLDPSRVDFSPSAAQFTAYALPAERRCVLPVLVRIPHEAQ